MITLHWSVLAAIIIFCGMVGALGMALMAMSSYADDKMEEMKK